MKRSGRRYPPVLILLVVLCLLKGPALALPPAPTVLYTAGKWLGNQLIGIWAGKTYDKLTGQDHEVQLRQVEASLSTALRKGAGDTQKLKVELEAARSQLQILNSLANSKPSAKEVENFRKRLASELENVKRVQEQHGLRISQLEKGKLDHDKELLDHSARLQKLEAQSGRGSSWGDSPTQAEQQGAHGERRNNQTTRRPRSAVPGKEGVTLMLFVSGNSNGIRIEEARFSGDADSGSFKVPHIGRQHLFQLHGKTGAVVLVGGDDNTVYLRDSLRGRVRVVDRGRRNRVAYATD